MSENPGESDFDFIKSIEEQLKTLQEGGQTNSDLYRALQTAYYNLLPKEGEGDVPLDPPEITPT